MVRCVRENLFGQTVKYECPRSDEPDLRYCCGQLSSDECCLQPSAGAGRHDNISEEDMQRAMEVISGIVTGLICLLLMVCCFCCFCCPFCLIHKRRKQQQQQRNRNGGAVPMQPVNPRPGGGYPSQPTGFPSQPTGYPSQPAGYPSQSAGYPSQPAGYPSGFPQPAGYPQSQPAGYPQPQPAGYPQPQPAGYPQPQPAGYPQPQPAGYPQPQPDNVSGGGWAAPPGMAPVAPSINPGAAPNAGGATDWRSDVNGMMGFGGYPPAAPADAPPPYASVQKQPPYNPNF